MPTPISIPCPQVIRGCDCTNDPVTNYSSEEPDQPVFFGNYDQPPTAGTWFAPGCVAECESHVSQQAADECAARQAAECSFDGTPGPGNPVPGGRGGANTPRFGNSFQSCDAECDGGGGTVTALVAPGTVITATQADADARAHALACKEAERVRVCFVTTSPLSPCCTDAQYTQPILVFGGTPPYTFSFVSGALPSGITFDPVGLLQGVSEEAVGGTFTFELAVTDSVGTTVIKEFTLRAVIVVPIANSLYPGVPYSAQQGIVGPTVAPVTWSIVAGALPPGLSLSPSGLISGTPGPTTTDEFLYTLQVIDSGTPPVLCTAASGIGRFCQGQPINIVDCGWNITGGGSGSLAAGNGTFDNNSGDANGPNFFTDLCNDTSYLLTVTMPFSASGVIPSFPFDIRFRLTYNGVTVAEQDFGGSFAAPWVLNDTAVLTAALPAQNLTGIRILIFKGAASDEVSGTIAITPLTRP